MGKAQFDLDISGKEARYSPHKERVAKRKSSAAWYYLGSIGEIGFAIAIPIAGGAVLGKYLDKLWSSYPKATLTLLLTGIFISLVAFIKTVLNLTSKRRPGTNS